ncbi:MAG: hypothetical protein ACE5RJ_03555 [Nitrosopumilaceae archaeon]
MAGLGLKQNKTKFLLAPFLMLILVGMGVSNAYAFTVSDAIKGLGMPDITIDPESGPAGSVVTINVSNLPMPPDGADPRLEFYMYLPASEEYGATLTKCGGHCMVLYSFDEIRNGKIYPKEITFALPSVKNTDSYSMQLSVPHKESGKKQGVTVSSVCDVVINGKTEYRLGYSCNNYNVPVGEYEVEFGWAVGMAGIYDKRESVTFTVTDESTSSADAGDPSDLIFKKYEQGEITITEFLAALKNKGWKTESDIRKALALVGELEHQRELVHVGESYENAVVPVSDVASKGNIVIPVDDNNSGASLSKTSSIVDAASTVYALVIGGVITGGAIFAAFGRNIF